MGSWEGIRRTVRATRYEFITLLAFFKNTTETHILNYCTRYAIGIRADFVSLVVVLPGMCFSFFRAVLYIDLKISTGWGTFRFFFFWATQNVVGFFLAFCVRNNASEGEPCNFDGFDCFWGAVVTTMFDHETAKKYRKLEVQKKKVERLKLRVQWSRMETESRSMKMKRTNYRSSWESKIGTMKIMREFLKKTGVIIESRKAKNDIWRVELWNGLFWGSINKLHIWSCM